MADPYDNKNFEFRVKTHVYEVLNTRELTVREVNLLKDAFKDAHELLLAHHTAECMKKQNDKFKSYLATAVAVVSVVNIIVTMCLKFWGP